MYDAIYISYNITIINFLRFYVNLLYDLLYCFFFIINNDYIQIF